MVIRLKNGSTRVVEQSDYFRTQPVIGQAPDFEFVKPCTVVTIVVIVAAA